MRSVVILGRPVSVNHMYRGGRRYLTEAGKQYKSTVALLCKDQNPELEKLKGGFIALVVYRWKDRRRRDITNYEKLIMDALSGILYNDDSQGVIFTAVKILGEPIESTTVQIYTMEEYHEFLEDLSHYHSLCDQD